MRRFLRARRTADRLGYNDVIGRLISKIAPDYFSYNWDWFIRSEVKLDSRILDVGCGRGNLLRDLRACGFRNLFGVDPFIDQSIKEQDLDIRKISMDAIDSDFDLIMFHHSLEHTPDPLTSLRSAKAHLSSTGTILVRLPVAGTWAWRTYGVDWVQLDPPRHLVVPTVGAMVNAAAQIGLRTEAVVFDSTSLQFYGSELYRRGRPLFLPDGRSLASVEQVFSPEEMSDFTRRADELNLNSDGDQACFYFKHDQ